MLEDYKFKVEMHCHTNPASACSNFPPESVIETYHANNVDGVCITNHFSLASLNRFGSDMRTCVDAYYSDYERCVEAAGKYGMKVYYGLEIRFSENNNDYLIFGVDKNDTEELYDYLQYDFNYFAEHYKNERAMLIQAHPFRNGIELVDPAYLDGVEVYNMHPKHNARIGFAAKYAQEHDLIATCGSDYHNEGMDNQGLTLFKRLPEDTYDIVDMLRSRDYIFEIGRSIVLPYGKIF